MMSLIYFILAQIPQDLPKVKTRDIPEDSNLEIFLVAGGVVLLIVLILFLRKYKIGNKTGYQNNKPNKRH